MRQTIFVPNANPGVAAIPAWTYLNFSVFKVNAGTLNSRIETLYNLEPHTGVSFPLPSSYNLISQAKFATNLEEVAQVTGIDIIKSEGIPTISQYDADELGGIAINEALEDDTIKNNQPWLKTAGELEKGRYKRLDIIDAIFDTMEKRVFTCTAKLVCTSGDQCDKARNIMDFFSHNQCPAILKTTREGGEGAPKFTVIPPKGFAIWASDRWGHCTANHNFFPLINHSFLVKFTARTEDSGRNISPHMISLPASNRPLTVILDLVFTEIQPVYKSTGSTPRNRSTADPVEAVSRTTNI